jgi:hypothetical protein
VTVFAFPRHACNTAWDVRRGTWVGGVEKERKLTYHREISQVVLFVKHNIRYICLCIAKTELHFI